MTTFLTASSHDVRADGADPRRVTDPGRVPRSLGNLPAEPNGFVGRHEDLARVKQALERSRLVTLCGVGGVGKTRLALRAAADVRGRFGDGAWLAELSAVREPALAARAVADAMGLPGTSPGDPAELLASHLADRDMLLILDDCEHVIDACAALAEVLARTAPRLRIIATGREPLDVVGEYTIMVSPLPATLSGGDSVELFVERAAATRPGFAPTPGDLAAVGRVCRRLDGIPLAIELAAVRLRTLSADQLAERLDDRFRLLGPARAGQHRHQTLQAAIAWSHELCSPAEQVLWARLSVFAGDFDLAAAEHVCAGNGLPAEAVHGVLDRLVGKSVVRYEPDRRRYRMLDTIRDFGAELLDHRSGDAHGMSPDELGRRHHRCYAELAERAAGARSGGDRLAWSRRLRAETANLRAALGFALATPGEEEAGLRLAGLLRPYWQSTGRFGEARDWCRRALAATSGGTAGRGWGIYAAGLFAVLQGDLAAAEPLLAEALEIADTARAPGLRARAVQEQGRAAFFSGDLDGALTRYEGLVDGLRHEGVHDPGALTVFADLASVLVVLGRPDEAIRVCDEGLRACDDAGEQWAWSVVLGARGAARWLGGAVAEAAWDMRESLRVRAAFGDPLGTAMCLDVLMACAAAEGRFERAGVLAGAADRMWRVLRSPVRHGPRYAELRAIGIATARKAVGEEAMRTAREHGRALPSAEAIALGLDAP